ncbi:hypothetical protein J3R75_000808 [Oligosphaera ethanolica]|uniref:Uncharacterized protein n=1 Tax=Oligosphaera ethanolica TaxID=760260 RepID=A0AAE4AMP0_9BACT|nr:hypothetical protein [Oligosphaera ethanolica]
MDWTMETFWTVGKDSRRLRLIGQLPGLLGSRPFLGFVPGRTDHVARSAKFGPEGRTMHSPG